MKFNPSKVVIKFAISGVEVPLHRCTCDHLTEGGVGVIYFNGTSMGSVELINSQLIINDDEDEFLIEVKDILSDIIY